MSGRELNRIAFAFKAVVFEKQVYLKSQLIYKVLLISLKEAEIGCKLSLYINRQLSRGWSLIAISFSFFNVKIEIEFVEVVKNKEMKEESRLWREEIKGGS